MTTHDDALDLEALFANHKQTGEPLGGHEVRAIIDAGLASEDEFDMTGGDLWTHRATFPDPDADETPPTMATTPSLTGEMGPTDVWFGAAAYGDRDCGDGHSRLFAKAYDHRPDEEEIRRDAFVEANPDWQSRFPGYTIEAACYEWQGNLTDALTIAIIPATRVAAPPTTP